MVLNRADHGGRRTLIREALVVDGSGAEPVVGDVTLAGDRIHSIEPAGSAHARASDDIWEGSGLALAPGFIDVHTHDDLQVVRAPDIPPKISQGVTTVIVGNCGVSGAPFARAGDLPEPMNLLGPAEAFRYPGFAAYVEAVEAARPAVNVAALVGHTALRANHMERFDREARPDEIEGMCRQLRDALVQGALGLSTGLAYANARAASTAEVLALAQPLAEAGGVYCTHLRSESNAIRDALDEAFSIGRQSRVPVIVSHLKCAGVANHGRSDEVLALLDSAAREQSLGCDCYPYTASSSLLDLMQVTDEFDILITWSRPHPEMGGRLLAAIASEWGRDLLETARRLQPAGAVYHCMAEADVERILRHPLAAIGSDGLPNDPLPHPRLWGAFPRVLGHYVRERRLFSLAEAVRKMTGLSAERFGLRGRGFVRPGYAADLVLFDPASIGDTATFAQPVQSATGIAGVWVNGVLTWRERENIGGRAGRFLRRGSLAPAGDGNRTGAQVAIAG